MLFEINNKMSSYCDIVKRTPFGFTDAGEPFSNELELREDIDYYTQRMSSIKLCDGQQTGSLGGLVPNVALLSADTYELVGVRELSGAGQTDRCTEIAVNYMNGQSVSQINLFLGQTKIAGMQIFTPDGLQIRKGSTLSSLQKQEIFFD